MLLATTTRTTSSNFYLSVQDYKKVVRGLHSVFTTEPSIKVFSAALISAGVYITRSFNELFLVFLCFMIFDYLSGWLAAAIIGELQSRKGWLGVVKKFIMILIVVMSMLLDFLISIIHKGIPPIIYPLVTSFFLGVEGLSVCENADRLGIPIPPFLRKYLKSLRNEGLNSDFFMEGGKDEDGGK
jgi:toxin secretion/phage lysis holin